MIKNTLLIALLASAMPAFAGSSAKNPVTPPPPAEAPAGLSYDFVTATYGHAFNDNGPDADAVGAGVSVSITDNIFAQAGIGFAGVDGLDDFNANASLGVHLPITGSIDFILAGGGIYLDVTEDVYATGTAAFRTLLAGKVDTTLGATYTDVGDGNWNGHISFWVPVAGQLDVGVSAALNLEHTELWSLGGGLRYRFK